MNTMSIGSRQGSPQARVGSFSLTSVRSRLRFSSAVIEGEARRRYPTWRPKQLMSTTAGLLTIVAVFSVTTYKLASYAVGLRELSAAQRQ